MAATLIPKGCADKPAYIMSGTGRSISFQELEDASNQGAQLFRQLGLKAGDHIALLLENHSEFFKICWAAHRAGLYYTAISYRLLEKEVSHIVNDCGASVFITGHDQAELAAKLQTNLPHVKHCYMIDGTIAGFDAWEDTLAAQAKTPIADQSEGCDMLYSSGTTGLPKGVKIPLRNVPFRDSSPLYVLISTLYKLDHDSIYLSPAPLYHAAPLRFNMIAMSKGATCIIMEKFDPEQALKAIEQYRVNRSQWVPTMFIKMLKLPLEIREKYDLSSLELAVHAAAPCPIPIKEQLIDWWGPVVFEYYAGTEGTGLTALDSQEWLEHKGSVGRAVFGIVHIVDDAGNEVPVGETGTVYFESASEFSYHNDPEKTRSITHEEGWTTLGDVGHLDQEGFLYLTDRKAFMIISGGVNIYPQEIENLLVTHPKVADVAVIGVPNEEFGEEVKAVVQPIDMALANRQLEDELLAFCRDHISAIKCPKSIDFDPELPRHPTGKLLKRLLKDRYWEKTESV